jgi:hypothetical protein
VVKEQEMKVILLVISLAVSSCLVEANSNGQKTDPFVDVPSSQRERLKSRLNEFIEYHRTKQWDKVYDLLGAQYKSAVEGGLPRDQFLKRKLYSRIRKFTPKVAQKAGDGWWMISGCGTFDRGGGVESLIEAYLQDGEWYFSDVWSVGLDSNISCKH